MRRIDAPPAGWYPDPESRTRLRWWDGLDWTDIRRAPPSNAELTRYEAAHPVQPPPQEFAQGQFQPSGGLNRQDAQQLIAEVRNVARSEIDRAANEFSLRARTAVREIQPLVSEYTNRIFRWVKIALAIAFVLLIAWFVIQVIFQASLFEWIGDRIDNLFNSDESGADPP